MGCRWVGGWVGGSSDRQRIQEMRFNTQPTHPPTYPPVVLVFAHALGLPEAGEEGGWVVGVVTVAAAPDAGKEGGETCPSSSSSLVLLFCRGGE